MMLKYDVYAKILKNNKLEIIELTPKTTKYIVSYPLQDKKYVRSFVNAVNTGRTSLCLKELIKKNETLSMLQKFLENKHLMAHYFGDEHPDNPFARQLEMFESLNRSEQSIESFQKKLLKKTVLIIGAGGVGTALANTLNAIGIGKIIIADEDRIERTNLSRQFLYTEDDVGKLKVQVLAKYLNKRGLGEVIPVAKMVSKSNFCDIVDDLPKINLVAGLPFPASSSIADLYCYVINRGYEIYATGEHDAGPLFTNSTQVEVSKEFTLRSYPLTVLQDQRREQISAHDRHPSFLPEIMITTSLAASEIVKYFTGITKMNTDKRIYSLHSNNYTVSLTNIDGF